MKVCVVWRQFGPYHHARLRACATYFRAHDAHAIGIEVGTHGGTHRWRHQHAETEILTLFPDRALESLSRRQIFTSVRALLDQIAPDAVAVPAYSRPESQAGVWWTRARRRVAVVMAESRHEDMARSPIRERIKRVIVSQFDAAVAGGTPQARYIQDLGIPRERIFWPYDVVDNDFFAARAVAARADPTAFTHLPGLQAKRPFFLAVGRFIERKNYLALLDAYDQYLTSWEESVPWDLVIVGDGPERPKLVARAAEIKPAGHVIFAGYRQIDDIAAYYGLARVFIHPATVDQWGLVVNEAMAAGLPVLVSSGAGAAEDLVSNGVNGYTFDPRDRVVIAEIMRRIASEADLETMRSNARARIAGWTPQRFAHALWDAVSAGAAHADRGMPMAARCVVVASQLIPSRILASGSLQQ
jgi:glycosyltransferase involved in cell wall biosynthesis